ncbi:MAG TPA: sigma-54 dependent transcriptional regulator [Gemmatimonadaceae bacterium]|jgi:DNA-binding NtrC family response regulator|nr:sigma-54 dependent transcriptional regulator [Gemmatimonadaceae bacterium]
MKVLLTLQDVEPAVRLNALLESEGVATAVVSPLDDMRAAIRREKPDIIVFSGDLADPASIALVKEQLWDGAASVGLSDVADDDYLERLRDAGYVELYPKPVSYPDVLASLKRILERRRLQSLTGLIGESDGVREVMVQVEQMAPVTATVLIEGESGTGKELVARALHLLNARKARPFIAVNVGALPETLLESELFGHEKGAFTGAAERRLGRFELADRGTLFLDEIGEIPNGTQVKLLRVLEEREFIRVGGTTPISVDVRVIAATNRPLREQVEQGSFRSDLFYRLNVLRIHLPPLRDRREDIPILVRDFIKEYSKQHDRAFHGISAPAMQILVEYPWPGNVRELRNLIESMVVLSPGHEIQPEDLPRQIRDGGSRYLPVHVGPILRSEENSAAGRELEFIVRSLIELKLQVEELRRRFDDERVDGADARRRDGWIGDVQPAALAGRDGVSLGQGGNSTGVRAPAIEPRDQQPPPNIVTVLPGTKMSDIERAVIEAALKETKGNRRRAAEMLAIGERTLYRKIKEYRLPEEEYSVG